MDGTAQGEYWNPFAPEQRTESLNNRFCVVRKGVVSKGSATMRHQSLANPDLSLAEVMNIWPMTISVFIRHRMYCVGCLVAPFHTVTEACAEYDLDEDDFMAELQRAAFQKPTPR